MKVNTFQVHTGPDLACQLHGSLSNNFVHKYRVMAENEAGCGPYSPPLIVKTGDACKYPLSSQTYIVVLIIGVKYLNHHLSDITIV